MKPFYLLLILFFLAACYNPLNKRNNQITQIELASRGCMINTNDSRLNCPVFAISIDSSLSYQYYGGRYATLNGSYTGKVTQGFWDTLNIKMEDINFKRQDTTDFVSMQVDGGGAEAIYHWDKYKRHLHIPWSMQRTDQSKHVFWWITDSYQHIKLKKVADTLTFEVNDHLLNPPKPEPLQKMRKVRFPSAN